MNFNVNIITSNNEFIEIPFNRFEYPNLMELVVDRYYEDIGECLGRGLCGTCHVKLIEGSLNDTKDISETKTLNQVNYVDNTSRLACQIILDEKINNLTFKIITDHK